MANRFLTNLLGQNVSAFVKSIGNYHSLLTIGSLTSIIIFLSVSEPVGSLKGKNMNYESL